MAFRYFANTAGNAPFVARMVVATGQTVIEGDFLRLLNGVVRRAATGSLDVIGVCKTPGTHVGLADGSIAVDVIIDPHGVWEADQDALADAAVQAGDLVDFNGNSSGIAANVNGDLRVVRHDATNNWVYVQPVNLIIA